MSIMYKYFFFINKNIKYVFISSFISLISDAADNVYKKVSSVQNGLYLSKLILFAREHDNTCVESKKKKNDF